MRAALSVTAYVFHGVPFGPVPARLLRYGLRLVMVEGLRFSSLPVSFTGFRLASCPQGFFVTAWGSLLQGFFVFASGQTELRWDFRCFRCGWLWWKRQASPLPPLWHAVSEEPPPFRLAVRGDGGSPGQGRTSVAGGVSRGHTGQTESGTRKGTWVVEACVVRHCQ